MAANCPKRTSWQTQHAHSSVSCNMRGGRRYVAELCILKCFSGLGGGRVCGITLLKVRASSSQYSSVQSNTCSVNPRTKEVPMKCRACPNEYPEPDVIDGTAYFVCASCGNVHEVENYRVYTPEERIEKFEKEHGVRLPGEYLRYAGTNDSWVVKLPPCNTDSTRYYFGEGFYEVGEFSGLDPDKYRSIFDSPGLVEEWGLPKKLVLIDGDGHTWLALDYRDSDNDPKVIVIESDEGSSLVVANNFKEFVSSLLSYASVYDTNGNIIYGS